MKCGRIPIAAILLITLCAFAADADESFSPKTIYRMASKAVVMVLATDDGKDCSGGTGSIIASEGMVLTNSHVVTSDKTGRPYGKIRVYLKPERLTGDYRSDLCRPCSAELVAQSEGLDLALLRIEGCDGPFPTVTLEDASRISIGEPVVAIGHPEQGGLWTLTTGAVSAVRKDHGGVKGKDVFQTDADINRGNSGGPLLRAGARMIGVNTSMARKSTDGMTIVGINFALQSSVAKGWLEGQGVRVACSPTDRPSRRSPDRPDKEDQGRPVRIEVIERPERSAREGTGRVREKADTPVRPKPVTRERENEISEEAFEAPGEWLMEGLPGRPYNLDSLLKGIFADVRSNADKAFMELEE